MIVKSAASSAICRRIAVTRLNLLFNSQHAGRMGAFLLTIAFHVLLLASAFSSDRNPGSPEVWTKWHGSRRAAPPLSTWIDLAPSNAPTASASLPVVHPRPLEFRPVELETAVVDGPAIEQDDSVPEYVRRMATLTARIQGLWELPRVQLAGELHCRARLRPGESGSLDEVELESCDASGPERASIAQAIERAMPLPLPQRPGVATDIVLQFIAHSEPNGSRHTSIEPAAE